MMNLSNKYNGKKLYSLHYITNIKNKIRITIFVYTTIYNAATDLALNMYLNGYLRRHRVRGMVVSSRLIVHE
jgi:hypothetical protein